MLSLIEIVVMDNSNFKMFDHKLNAEQPFIVEYFDSCVPIPQAIVDMHLSVHLGVLLKGNTKAWVAGEEIDFEAGSAWLTAPLEPHTTLSQTKDKEAIVFTFSVDELWRMFADWQIPFFAPFTLTANARHKLIHSKNREEILRLALELKEITLAYNKPHVKFRQWLKLHEIFTIIISTFENEKVSKKDTSGFERLNAALILPKKKLGKPVSLEEAAKACSLSVGRFSELFRKYTGNSFGQYEMRYRLSGARLDILSGLYTLQDIATNWGFYDESHLSHLFKRIYRCSPLNYRKKKLILMESDK